MTLSIGDIVLFGGVLLVFAALAWTAGEPKPTARDAFLAERRLSWPQAFAALLAAEVSALTLVGVAAAAFTTGWSYGQFFLGSLAGRAASWSLIPRLREGEPPTVYGWLGRRAGASCGRFAGALFCAARLWSSSLRLAAAALALSLVTGLAARWWALLLAACAALYVGRGGLRAVVLTSGWQCLVFLAAAGSVCGYALAQIPGGVHAALRLAGSGGRLAFYASAPALLSACVNGAAGAMAGFLADHELAQKLLACRSDADARRAVAASACASALTLGLLLSVGVSLYAYYAAHPALAVPERFDTILPHFAATVLPQPLRGLLVAALFLAAVDLPLSSLSAASWSDVARGGEALPRRARWSLAGGWSAALLLGSFWLMGSARGAAGAAATWPVAGGPLLGLILAAVWAKEPRPGRALAALAGATALTAGLAWGTTLDTAWLTTVGAACGYWYSR